MKKNYEFIRSKELKFFLKQLQEQYGAIPEMLRQKVFVKRKEKILLSPLMDKNYLRQQVRYLSHSVNSGSPV